MADKKISALTAASTPLAGTEVLPIVQSGVTVKVANNDLRPKQIQSNATSGVLQISGPGASATRVMTAPDADFTVARTDATQTFTGTQAFSIVASSTANTQNKTQQILYENTNGGYSLANGYSTAFYSYANGATSGNVAYVFNGGSYFQVATGIVAIVGTTFTIGGNTYTVTNASPEGYVYVTPDASGEAASGTLTGLEYATERLRIDSSGNQTLKAGNLIQGTAAKGINFTANTPAAGMTSQLLNWYEEGTWTPTLTAGSGTITSYTSSGRYTRIGRLVTVEIRIDITNNGTGATGLIVGSFPFTAPTATTLCGATREDVSVGFGIVGSGYSTTQIYLTKVDNTYPGGTNYGFTLVVTYSV